MYKKRIGLFGENLAADFLKRRGYVITGRNVYVGHCEIDLIAKIKEKIIFIEVKTRTTYRYGGAEEAVGERKIKNIKKAVNYFINKHEIHPDNVRVDFIAVDLNRTKKIANIKHIKAII